MCWFGGFPGVWQYSTASALSKEDVFLSCYNENWLKAVSLLPAVLAELHLRRGSETKTTTLWEREILRGRKWTPITCLGQRWYPSASAANGPTGSERCISWRRQLSPGQTALKEQSRDNPLPQQPHIRGPVSSYGALRSRGELSWLLSTMAILRHAKWPIWIWLRLGTHFCFLPADLQLCQIVIFLVIHCVHPHKDCVFVFDSLQTTFSWILVMVPQSTTAFVCLGEIFVDPELVKSIILPLPFSGDVLLLSHI